MRVLHIGCLLSANFGPHVLERTPSGRISNLLAQPLLLPLPLLHGLPHHPEQHLARLRVEPELLRERSHRPRDGVELRRVLPGEHEPAAVDGAPDRAVQAAGQERPHGGEELGLGFDPEQGGADDLEAERLGDADGVHDVTGRSHGRFDRLYAGV